jgi:hypothetical protein
VKSTAEYALGPAQPVSGLPRAATLHEYVAGLRAGGVAVFQGDHGSYWVSSAERVVRRLPTFDLRVPSPSEVDEALAATGGLVASYVTEPDDRDPGNAWLYLCGDRDYSLQCRPPAMQRNVRRAMRELAISALSPIDLMAHGGRAFCDTRRRNRLDDGTLNGFYRYFEHRIARPGWAYLGAWKNGQLAAFVTIMRVDDWAELGSFSMNSMLGYRPNDALLYVTLSNYLAMPNCRVVSYGLSSIQPGCGTGGLHRFKLKVGFHPKRVHRAFVLHPSVRPFANCVTLAAAHSTVNAALRIQPRNRRLKKLGGMLACMLGVPSMVEAPEVDLDVATSGNPALHQSQLSAT